MTKKYIPLYLPYKREKSETWIQEGPQKKQVLNTVL